ncbi:MAG: hypothetical protein GOMPHAMPRED_005191 [Gomphillus americanus]|uniref:Uncharacterized protein n=1 Tax=Gomphillus americanus TaxID=1940652 RepID=A0A8H3IHX2_9LECA|nr:MAG: hypothetical protein GOMPHAMPRED_005191 [Gomphillus americanus]
MVPPPPVISPFIMPGAVSPVNLPAVEPSILIVKPEVTARSIVNETELVQGTRNQTHPVSNHTVNHNYTKGHVACDKNYLEPHELPSFKRVKPEDDLLVYSSKDRFLHKLPRIEQHELPSHKRDGSEYPTIDAFRNNSFKYPLPIIGGPKVANLTANLTEAPANISSEAKNSTAAIAPAVFLVDPPKNATAEINKAQSVSEQASIDLLHQISMTIINHLVKNIRQKEKQFLADKVSQKHQSHIAAVTVCRHLVRNGGDFAECMHSISSKEDEGFVDVTEHTIQTRNHPRPEKEHALSLSPQFIGAIDVFNRLPEIKVKHLEALSRMMDAEAELHAGTESEYWQWHDFREFSTSFRQGVLKVIEYTQRRHRHHKSSVTCDQLTSAFHEIITIAEAIEDGTLYESELVYWEPTKYLVSHPEIHTLYQKALKHCVKKDELKDLISASDVESSADLKIIADANRGAHWTEEDASLSFPRKSDRHRDERNNYYKRDEQNVSSVASSYPTISNTTNATTILPRGANEKEQHPTISNMTNSIPILPREADEKQCGIVHLDIGSGTLAALGLLSLVLSIFCIWFKQYCARRARSRQQLPMSSSSSASSSASPSSSSSSPYNRYPLDVKNNNSYYYWDQESGIIGQKQEQQRR